MGKGVLLAWGILHCMWSKLLQYRTFFRLSTWGRGDAPPLRVKNKSPTLHQKNGYPSQKILDPFYSIPPYLGFFYCVCRFFHQTEKLQQLTND